MSDKRLTLDESDGVKLAEAPIVEQQAAIAEMVTVYPDKVSKKRSNHIVLRDAEQPSQEIGANTL